jgi:hypothetical protein
MVIWHVTVAGALLLIWLQPIALLPFVSLPFLLPMAVLYLLGAVFYAWKYVKNHAVGVAPSAELIVEGRAQALCGRLLASLNRAGVEVVEFDFTDLSHGTVKARTSGAQVVAAIEALPAAAPIGPADRHRRSMWRGRRVKESAPLPQYLVRVEGKATRRLDGLPQARQRIDDFLKVFLP